MNALVDVRFTLDIPEHIVNREAGEPDDGSQRWFEKAMINVEQYVREDIVGALEYAYDEPEVEAN